MTKLVLQSLEKKIGEKESLDMIEDLNTTTLSFLISSNKLNIKKLLNHRNIPCGTRTPVFSGVKAVG